jgi:hypothetical protein
MQQLFSKLIVIALAFSIGLLLCGENVLAIPQGSATEIFQTGSQKLQTGKYLEAIADFTQAIKLKNDFGVAYVIMRSLITIWLYLWFQIFPIIPLPKFTMTWVQHSYT